MQNLIILYAIVIIINIFLVFSFFVRLVGVETKRWSTSNSIFQIINLLPRTIGVFQIPLITLFTEYAINTNKTVSPLFYQGVIFFNLIGVLIGFTLLPFFLNSLKETINSIYANDSFKIIFKKNTLKTIISTFFSGSFNNFFRHSNQLKVKNKKLFFYNLMATFFLCSAFPACVWAGYNLPAYRATIISLVSIIYGAASVITILFIDTKLSVITDKTFHNQISLSEYKIVLFDCLKGKIIGTLIGVIALPLLSGSIVYLVSKFLI